MEHEGRLCEARLRRVSIFLVIGARESWQLGISPSAEYEAEQLSH
jgi:hypothetical protein